VETREESKMKHLIITTALIATISNSAFAEGVPADPRWKEFGRTAGQCIIENADGAAIGATVGTVWGAGAAMTGTKVGAATVGYGAGMSGPWLGMAAFSNPFTGFTVGLMMTGAAIGAGVGAAIDIGRDGCN